MQNKKLNDDELKIQSWIDKHKIPWLFPANGFIGQSTDYVEHFTLKHGPMMVCQAPVSYKWSLLEKYKKKIAFSQHMVTNVGILPYTMLQFGSKFHVAADWRWEEGEKDFVIALTMFYEKHEQYLKMMEDNREFEFYGQQREMGYGGGASNHQVGFGVRQSD